MTPPSPEVQLLETMKVEGGKVALLSRHLERLARSARELHYSCDINMIGEYVRRASEACLEGQVARLVVASDGSYDLRFRTLPPTGRPAYLRLSKMHANPSDPLLQNKTTARRFYEEARAGLPEEADALIANTRGELTETTILNIALIRNGRWVTPPVSCGLLPGVMRAELLDRGEIVEGVLRVEDLQPGEVVRCFNAVRGVMDVEFRG